MERLVFEDDSIHEFSFNKKTLAIMKKKYYVFINQTTKNHKHNKALMRQDWINELTKTIIAEENLAAKIGSQSKQLQMLSQNYQVKRKDDKCVLTVKSKNKKTWNKMIPLEHSFETALYAHLKTKHGGTFDMLGLLETSGMAIAQICLPIIRQVCETITKNCEKYKEKKSDTYLLSLLKDSTDFDEAVESIPEELNLVSSDTEGQSDANKDAYTDAVQTDPNAKLEERTGTKAPTARKRKKTKKSTAIIAKSRKTYEPPVVVKPNIVPAAMVTIIDMSRTPDKMYHFLLVYEDFETRYVQLRPLTNADIVVELTMEIFKIFCDFTPPKCIVTNIDFKNIFEGVLDRLKEVFDSSILLETSEHEVLADTISSIDIRLKQWYLSFKSDAWSIGCHAVQWQINSKISGDGSTAQKRFFGINPKHNGEQQKDIRLSSDVGTSNSIIIDLDDFKEELNDAPTLTRLKPHINLSDKVQTENNRTDEDNIGYIDKKSCTEVTSLIIDSDDDKTSSVNSDLDNMDVEALHIEESVSLKSEHDDSMDVVIDKIDIEEELDNLDSISIKPEEDKNVYNSIEKEVDSTKETLSFSERIIFEPTDGGTVKSETENEISNYVFAINRSDVGSQPNNYYNIETPLLGQLLRPQSDSEQILSNEVSENTEHRIETVTQTFVEIPETNSIVTVLNVDIQKVLAATPDGNIVCCVCQNRVVEPMSCHTCKSKIHSFCGGTHFFKGFCCLNCL